MGAASTSTTAGALRLLEELPGIGDVVWATVTRLASARVPTALLFTAADERAGTSVLACATAIALAQHQRVPVCLLETNVRRPAVADYLGLEQSGLSDVLDGRAEFDACLQEPRACPGLFVLHAGTPRAPVSGEFTTERWTSILARLEQRCHYLIIDTAPVLEHVETRLLLHHADALVLVLRARATRLAAAQRALEILTASGTPVLGSIFNAYASEDRWGGSRSANRAFERAVSAERPLWHDSSVAQAVAGAKAALEVELDPALPSNGHAHSANGFGESSAHAALDGSTEAEQRRQIDILERRIVKLTQLLEQTEADLQRMAASKSVDLGIASIYRGVQGLSSQEAALALKRSLMREIFQANLELKSAIARHT